MNYQPTLNKKEYQKKYSIIILFFKAVRKKQWCANTTIKIDWCSMMSSENFHILTLHKADGMITIVNDHKDIS